MNWLTKLNRCAHSVVDTWKNYPNGGENNSTAGKSPRLAPRNGNMPSAYSLVREVKYGMGHAELGGLLKNGAVVVHSTKFKFAETAMFVASVFRAVTGCEAPASLIYEECRNPQEDEIWYSGYLVFDQETHKVFSDWLVTYRERFDAKNMDLQLPEICDGQWFSGVFVKHNCSYEEVNSNIDHDGRFLKIASDEMLANWVWLVKYTTGKIRILDGMWIFESPAEAMQYSLQCG
jgi:hypothetical protein